MNSMLFLAADSSIADRARETAETFGFHWQLFLSQCISFVVVAILLQKFAYKPILTVLEERRKKIAEADANAEKIRQQLADAEKRFSDRLLEANNEALRIIEEARNASTSLRDRKAQEAISEAEQIILKAREASIIERDKLMAELKKQVGRLVIDTTSRVAGKVLTSEDQRRLSEETAQQITAA